jgi:hypothetical protein
MADPTREQIEAHGEDCHQPLTVAKADQAKARDAVAQASERKIQAEARLRSAELPFADADRAADLLDKGHNTDRLWKEHEAARREDFEAGAELSRARKALERADARVMALREEAVAYIGEVARRMAEREYLAVGGHLKAVDEAHDRALQARAALEKAVGEANRRARAVVTDEAARRLRDRFHPGRYVKTHVFEGLIGSGKRDGYSLYRQFVREAQGIGLQVD